MSKELISFMDSELSKEYDAIDFTQYLSKRNFHYKYKERERMETKMSYEEFI